jgi:hypothetical protein
MTTPSSYITSIQLVISLALPIANIQLVTYFCIVVKSNWDVVASPRLANVDGALGGAFAGRQEGGSDA